MGALCSGVPGVPQAPEIDISAEDIASATADAMSGIPQAILDNEKEFRGEVNKCGDDDKFEVPDTNIVLTKSSSDDDIHAAAIAGAFATTARDAVKVSLSIYCLFVFFVFEAFLRNFARNHKKKDKHTNTKTKICSDYVLCKFETTKQTGRSMGST